MDGISTKEIWSKKFGTELWETQSIQQAETKAVWLKPKMPLQIQISPWKSIPNYWKNYRAEWQALTTILLQYLHYLILCPSALTYQHLKKMERGSQDLSSPKRGPQEKKRQVRDRSFSGFFSTDTK